MSSLTNDASNAGATLDAISTLKTLIGEPIWRRELRTEWLIDGFVEQGMLALLSGESGKGKSWVALQIAKSVALGEKFLERTVVKRPVLYVDGEMGGAAVKDRLAKIGLTDSVGLEEQLLIWGQWADRSPNGPKEETILAFAQQTKGLIIFDSLIEFHPGDENNSAETRRYMKLFKRLAHECGATVVVLHHSSAKGKNSREFRGSTDIKGAVDTAYLVTSKIDTKERDADGNVLVKIKDIVLTPFKQRSGVAFSKAMQFQPGVGLILDGDVPVADDEQRSRRADLSRIVHLNPGSSQSELTNHIKTHYGYDRKTVLSDLEALELAREIRSAKDGKSKTSPKRYFPLSDMDVDFDSINVTRDIILSSGRNAATGQEQEVEPLAA